MNSLDKQNVMWGAGIQVADQAGGYAGFFTHMDNKEGAYAKSAPKLISKQLYNRISATDIRRDWWDPSDKESPYVSKKSRSPTWPPSWATTSTCASRRCTSRPPKRPCGWTTSRAHAN